MKIKSHYTKLMIAGTSAVLFLSPAMAIEKPPTGDAALEQTKKRVLEEAPKKAEQEMKKLPMLGVGGVTVSDTLSSHLGIQAGSGLTLYRIVPGSAAEKAGLQAHDVLTEFDAKKIGSQEDLREAVFDKKPGDEVEVKFYRGGKAQEKKLTLGERKDQPMRQRAPGIDPQWMQENLGPEVLLGPATPIDKEIQHRMLQMRRQLERQGGMRLDLGELFNKAQKENKGDGVFNFDAQTSITLMDNDGSINMKTLNGKKSITVKDKDGNVEFDGPFETEQDKAAVPEGVRERINRLGIEGKGNGMKLNIRPLGGVFPPDGDRHEAPVE